MIPVDQVETDKCTVAMDEHGICWLLFARDNIPIHVADSRAIVAARRRLGASEQDKQLLCVDLAATPRPDKQARDFTNSPAVTGITKAMAMITGGAMSRLIGNFFLGFNRQGFPTRLFTSEQDAVSWLLAQSGQSSATG